MAERQEEAAVLDRRQFCCSICLDPLQEPVTIPCGHNYCKSCIEQSWDQNEEKGEYSCPQCRETLSLRPVLRRNDALTQLVEKLKTMSSQQACPPADVDCAGPSDVACDFCCGTKPNKATMFCLMCLASYCPAHLAPHYSVPVLKKHQLVSATAPLQEKICMKHNKLMDFYCLGDKKFICCLCFVEEHKMHSIVSAATERAKVQEDLIASKKKVQVRIQERKDDLYVLDKALKDFKSCSKTAAVTSDELFEELVSFVKTKCTLTKQLIEAQEEAAVAQAEELKLQLEEELDKLERKDIQLEQLSHTDDHISFIQTFQSLSLASCESPDLPQGPVVPSQHSFNSVTDCLSKMSHDMKVLLNDTWSIMSDKASVIDVVQPPVPQTREEFLRYHCPLMLDVNSANMHLSISPESRRATDSPHGITYTAHSDRFTYARQVLCLEGLSGRCYWEVSGISCYFSVAVSYKDICRSSQSSTFGINNKSWSLECSPRGYFFQHNNVKVAVSDPKSSKIGVYLDYKAGTLSFYSVSDTMTLLHRERTKFTQPLYPGLGLTVRHGLSGGYVEVMVK